MSGPRTWEATWVTPELQYAYDKGVFEGVCVFAGLMGMAEAIRENAPEACPVCLKYSSGSVHGMGGGSWLKLGEWMCNDCYDTEKARRERSHPYR